MASSWYSPVFVNTESNKQLQRLLLITEHKCQNFFKPQLSSCHANLEQYCVMRGCCVPTTHKNFSLHVRIVKRYTKKPSLTSSTLTTFPPLTLIFDILPRISNLN